MAPGFFGWCFCPSLLLIHVTYSRLCLLAWLILSIVQGKKENPIFVRTTGSKWHQGNEPQNIYNDWDSLQSIQAASDESGFSAEATDAHVVPVGSHLLPLWEKSLRHLLCVSDVHKECSSGGQEASFAQWSQRPSPFSRKWGFNERGENIPAVHRSENLGGNSQGFWSIRPKNLFRFSAVTSKRQVCKMTAALEPDCDNLIKTANKRACWRGVHTCFYMYCSLLLFSTS